LLESNFAQEKCAILSPEQSGAFLFVDPTDAASECRVTAGIEGECFCKDLIGLLPRVRSFYPRANADAIGPVFAAGITTTFFESTRPPTVSRTNA